MPSAVLGIVPARAGSKGIPGKNIRLLAGRPLLEYTVEAARASGVIDRLVLSTDSEEIAAVGRRVRIEVPFLRPPSLAQDESPMLGVLEHAVSCLEASGWSPRIIVVLQPTSPLRRGAHIAEAVALLRETRCDSVVSVIKLPRHLSPDYVMRIADGRLRPFLSEGERLTRRQDARPAYSRDGTVYAFWRDTLMTHHTIYGDHCRPLEIDRSESLSLDTQEDWEEAERRVRERRARRDVVSR